MSEPTTTEPRADQATEEAQTAQPEATTQQAQTETVPKRRPLSVVCKC